SPPRRRSSSPSRRAPATTRRWSPQWGGLRRRPAPPTSSPARPASASISARLMVEIERAIAALGVTRRRLASGAGHDAMAIAGLCDVGMIFVRCKGGISHNPAESITEADAEIGARVLYGVLRKFQPRDA